MELKDQIRQSLRTHVLGEEVLDEAKSVDAWWDKLPAKQKSRLGSILGLAKGKDKKAYAKLDAASQDEVASYYRKHRGKVESTEGETSLDEEGVYTPSKDLPKMQEEYRAWKKRNDALQRAKRDVASASKNTPFDIRFIQIEVANLKKSGFAPNSDAVRKLKKVEDALVALNGASIDFASYSERVPKRLR